MPQRVGCVHGPGVLEAERRGLDPTAIVDATGALCGHGSGGAAAGLLACGPVQAEWVSVSRLLGSTMVAGLLTACGLFVGFSPRDLCEDCNSADAGSGGLGPNSGGAASTSGSGGSGNAMTTTNASTTRSSGGSLGNGGSSAGSGGNGGNGGSGLNTGGSGGASTGGSESGGSSGSGGSGAMGGVGGSTTGVGGSAGANMLGENYIALTLEDATCESVRQGTVADAPHASSLAFAVASLGYLWHVAWFDEANVLYRAMADDSQRADELRPLASAYPFASSEGSSPLIGAYGTNAVLGYGELAAGASLVAHQFSVLAPNNNPSSGAAASQQALAPRVESLTLLGSSGRFVVGSVESDGRAWFTHFGTGLATNSTWLGSSVEAVTSAWLGSKVVALLAQGSSVSASLLDPNASDLAPTDLAPISDVTPDTSLPYSLSAASYGTGVVLVWVTQDAVVLTQLNADGTLKAHAELAQCGRCALPNVTVYDTQIAVSWQDTESQKLFVSRLWLDERRQEQPLEVASNVSALRHGLAIDAARDTHNLGVSYGSSSLELLLLGCQ